jgi:hypothetical protein
MRIEGPHRSASYTSRCFDTSASFDTEDAAFDELRWLIDEARRQGFAHSWSVEMQKVPHVAQVILTFRARGEDR